MKPVLRVGAGPVVDYHAAKNGVASQERLVDNTLEILKGRSNQPSDVNSDVIASFNGFMTGPERHNFNGIVPSENDDDAEKLRFHWNGYAMGGDYGPSLKERSRLADKIESGEETEEIVEELENVEEWIVEGYEERGNHALESATVRNGFLQLETVLGIYDEENSTLRVLKPNGLSERQVVDAAFRLSGSEADRIELLGMSNEMERLELSESHALDIIGGDIDDVLNESSKFYSRIIDETVADIRSDTGLGFESMDNHSFLDLILSSDIDTEQSFSEAVQKGISRAAKEYDRYEDIKEEAASYASSTTGIMKPDSMDADFFLSQIDGADRLEIKVIETLERNALEEAERISDQNYSKGSLRGLLDYLDEGVFRDTDIFGNRVYRWNGNEAFSVTTVLNPFPNDYDDWDEDRRLEYPFHREIDTGGGLFHWKNIYDGSDGRYDADVIRDYAGDRGTLAHEEIFANYVDDESEVRGETDRFWNNLESLEGEELQDIVDWKGDDEIEVLEYAVNDEGFVQNGKDLARKEVEWIEKQFRSLEDDLGLSKENVIYAEQEFALQTQHPWDESDEIDGPEIGEFAYGGTADMIYEHEGTGETILLDLKTGSMKPKYAIQQAAYKHAIENSDYFDDPRLDEGIDRVVVPEIDPESMMYSDKEPVIHTDQPHNNGKYETTEFLDASDIKLENSNYRVQRWRPENWDEEALYVFARAAENMPDPQ
ncbi:MAG: hypothetical protein ABEJ03_04025 [Candidatus Nanohaloarchaea archaeon]